MPPTHFPHRASRSPFLSCPPAKRIRKRPYFPLPPSILTGTNLIMLLLLLFFLQPPFDSQENPSPIRFPGKFILVWFPRKSKQKPCNPCLIPKKIHPPFDFRENSSSFDFRENPSKNPKENQKSLRFLDPF